MTRQKILNVQISS